MKTATAPDPRKSEVYQRSYATLGAKFKMLDTMGALCAEYRVDRYPIALEFVERGLSVDEARRELAQLKANREWTAALAAVNSPMH